MTLFHLYAAASTVDQQSLREIHVAFALSLVFLLFPDDEELAQPHRARTSSPPPCRSGSSGT